MTILPPLTVLGEASPSGSYVLRIAVAAGIELAFGRFKRGKSVFLPSGEYVDVGSALGKTGSVTLGRRLVRHATRTGSKPPHAIRAAMLEHFPTLGLSSLLPVNGKHLFWNVDHLLDRQDVDLMGAILIRSTVRMERELGQFLERDPVTVVVEPGLGANDVPGNTHILRVEADESWWCELPSRLDALRHAVEENQIEPLTPPDSRTPPRRRPRSRKRSPAGAPSPERE